MAIFLSGSVWKTAANDQSIEWSNSKMFTTTTKKKLTYKMKSNFIPNEMRRGKETKKKQHKTHQVSYKS